MRICRPIRIAAILTATLVWGWLLTACSSDRQRATEPDVPAAGGSDVESPVLSINMRMPMPAAAGFYSDGNLYENFIDVDAGDFRVYFFDSANRFIAEFTPMFVNAVDGSDFREYEMTGHTVSTLSRHHDFKVMVLANWASYPADLIAGKSTIDEICADQSATFEALTSFANLQPGSAMPMPFYGISSFTGIDLEAESYAELPGSITLLRAMAKIEIEVDTDDNTTLTSAELVGYNRLGFCAPAQTYSEADYGNGLDWTASYMRKLHLTNNGDNDAEAAGRRLSFSRVAQRTATTREKWVAYAPEFRNVGSDGSPLPDTQRSRIAVSFTGRVSATQYIDFKYYSEPPVQATGMKRGDHFNIKRNYCYRYTLKKDKEQLSVEVDVEPYTKVELNPEFGLDRDENTGYAIINHYAPDVYYYDPDTRRHYDKNYKEMAERVEKTANGLFVVRDIHTGHVRYTFDAATGLYYLDTERKTRLTTPDQLSFENATATLKIIRTNDYGEAIYFWDTVKKRCIDDSGITVPLPCFGYQLLPTDKAYMVIDYTGVGNYRVVYHLATDRYYMLNDDNSMTEMQAFPPKK